MLPLALLASAALPFYAFVSGHPFRIRYEVPLILGGAAVHRHRRVGLLRCAGAAGRAAAAVLVIALQTPPFDRDWRR